VSDRVWGSKKQEARSRKQEAGSKKQEARSRKQEARSKKHSDIPFSDLFLSDFPLHTCPAPSGVTRKERDGPDSSHPAPPADSAARSRITQKKGYFMNNIFSVNTLFPTWSL
jgi:hypothetical protein